MKLSIRQLKAIREVAATSSFTVAASNLYTTQSNLSIAIREAEEIVGLRLFDRTTKYVWPTAAGQSFAAVITRTLDDLEAEIARLQLSGSLAEGMLSIGVGPLLGSTLIATVAAQFYGKYPGITIKMEDATTHVLADLLARRQIELAIGTFEAHAEDVSLRPLFEDKLIALSHPSLGLAESVTWQELANHKFIGIVGSSAVGRLVTHAFWSSGRRKINPVITSRHWLTVLSLTSSMRGICVAPEYAYSSQLSGELVRSEITEPVVSRKVSVASAKGISLSPAAQAFEAMLTEVVSARH